jgi:hypothetical protein
MMMICGCRCTDGGPAVTWLLPGDPHCVADPVSVQLSREAVADGAAAIAAAAPPATSSGRRERTKKVIDESSDCVMT